MTCIYKILSPTGNIYIGQTVNLKKRLYAYSRHECSTQKALHRSFVKYGFSNHALEILHELPSDVGRDVLNDYEILYIAQHKECGYTLLNMTSGGGGMNGHKHSEETRRKISVSSSRKRNRRCGSKHSEETKRKMTLSRIGKKPTEQTLLKMSKSQLARRARMKEPKTQPYNG